MCLTLLFFRLFFLNLPQPGRIFLRQPNTAIQDELVTEDKELEAEIESLQAKQAYLVKERESAERQLAELAGKLQSAQLVQ